MNSSEYQRKLTHWNNSELGVFFSLKHELQSYKVIELDVWGRPHFKNPVTYALFTIMMILICTLILITELVVATDDQCEEYHFQTPFHPGDSCQDIYSKNLQTHDKSGYYWILDGPSKVFCGMNYTGSSCEDIYSNNPEIHNKSGYYRINDTQWSYCNMTLWHDKILNCCMVDLQLYLPM